MAGDADAPGGEVSSGAPRRRRRAVGPAGAWRPAAGAPAPLASPDEPSGDDDDERFLREVPPHHGGP
jgi:hypothetical protein